MRKRSCGPHVLMHNLCCMRPHDCRLRVPQLLFQDDELYSGYDDGAGGGSGGGASAFHAVGSASPGTPMSAGPPGTAGPMRLGTALGPDGMVRTHCRQRHAPWDSMARPARVSVLWQLPTADQRDNHHMKRVCCTLRASRAGTADDQQQGRRLLVCAAEQV